jgi:hypothetical protein
MIGQNYSKNWHQGCSIAAYCNDSLLWERGAKYKFITIPVLAVFPFIVITSECRAINWPFTCPLVHMSVDSDIDYDHFTSLN